MGTTPTYGLPYPTETDDADVPLDMQELADTLDGIMLGRTLVDAKGDLLAGSGADTVARVPVGTDGRVLSADAASPAGLKWIQLAGAYVPVTDKGAANGVATLDATGKVPTAQLPPGGGVGTLFDAKGDILAGFANDDPRRLAVGSNGQVLTADTAQALGVKWATPAAGGGGGGVDHKGAWNAGTAYVGGDVVTYGGVDYLAVNPSTGQTPPAAAAGGVGIGTSLPASPSDGTEYVLVDSLTAPTYAWRFRYVASITDAYKWVSVGGAEKFASVDTAETTASTTAADLATVGPSFTVPRSGIYDVMVVANMTNNAAGVFTIVCLKEGAAAATDQNSMFIGANLYVEGGTTVQRTLNAGELLKMQYRATGGTATYSRRRMTIRPLRVA